MNHLGLGLALGLQQYAEGSGPTPTNWILENGTWNDGGIWIDEDNWIDGE